MSGGRDSVPLATRFRILKRDNFTCVYCDRRPPAVQLVVDHAKAHANGGTDSEANLVSCCEECNKGKGGTDADYRATAKAMFVGKFFHLIEDGKINRQGRVAFVDGEYAMVQWFSALDGTPSTQQAYALSEVASDKFRFYESHRAWMLAWHYAMSDHFSRGVFENEEAWTKWYESTFPDGVSVVNEEIQR